MNASLTQTHEIWPRLDLDADLAAEVPENTPGVVACARHHATFGDRMALTKSLTSPDLGPEKASRPDSLRCKALIVLCISWLADLGEIGKWSIALDL